MKDHDKKYVRQTLAMAYGAILMSPNTETKSELVERLRRSLERIDAVEIPLTGMEQYAIGDNHPSVGFSAIHGNNK